MASNYTANYSLPQWDMDDRILVEEFNEAMLNIDDNLFLKAQVIFGSYDGDNAAERTIALGVTPKAVLLMDQRGTTCYPIAGNQTAYGGLALKNSPVAYAGITALEIVEGGFKVFYGTNGNFTANTNYSSFSYNYIAFY